MGLLLDILSTAAMLFIVTAGLMIIFGVMKIVNFAHGAIITLGSYASLVVTQLGLNPWLALPAALAAGVATGLLVERLIVQPLYKRPLDAILATWGLGIVIGQLITMAFGREVQFVDSPVQGAASLLGTEYSAYRLFLIPAALLLYLLLTLLLNRTRFGVHARRYHEREPGARAGHPGRAHPPGDFRPGRGPGARALITPLSSVDPNMGLPWLVSAFMLVMVSGHSIGALLLTCLVYGACQVLVSVYLSPILGGVTIAVLAALTLRIRPQGFSHD